MSYIQQQLKIRMASNSNTDGGKYKCLKASSGMSPVALTPSADGRMVDGRHSLNILQTNALMIITSRWTSLLVKSKCETCPNLFQNFDQEPHLFSQVPQPTCFMAVGEPDYIFLGQPALSVGIFLSNWQLGFQAPRLLRNRKNPIMKICFGLKRVKIRAVGLWVGASSEQWAVSSE